MRNNNTTQEPSLLLGIDETAIALGIGRTNVYTLLKAGELSSVKIGERRLVLRASIEAFISSLQRKEESR